MEEAGLLLAAPALLLAACGGGGPDREEAVSWTVPEEEACQGITVGWPVGFGEHGFPVSEAATALELRPGKGGGFEGETGLVARSRDRWSVATGPESASRYASGSARVRFEDPGFLGGLELGERPPIASLDRHFHRDFTFRRESPR